MRGLNKNKPAIATQEVGALSFVLLWDGSRYWDLGNYSRHSDAIRGAKRMSQKLSFPYLGKVRGNKA